jgi:hypothetical protein
LEYGSRPKRNEKRSKLESIETRIQPNLTIYWRVIMRNLIKSLVLVAVFVAASAPAHAWTLAVDRAMAHYYNDCAEWHWSQGHALVARAYLSYSWTHIVDARTHYGAGSIAVQAAEYAADYNAMY